MDVYKDLEIKKDFSSWIKQQIERFELVENKDYVVFTLKGENLKGGRPSIVYGLLNETAQLIIMGSNVKKAKELNKKLVRAFNNDIKVQAKIEATTSFAIDLNYEIARWYERHNSNTSVNSYRKFHKLVNEITDGQSIKYTNDDDILKLKREIEEHIARLLSKDRDYYTIKKILVLENIDDPKTRNKKLVSIEKNIKHGKVKNNFP